MSGSSAAAGKPWIVHEVSAFAPMRRSARQVVLADDWIPFLEDARAEYLGACRACSSDLCDACRRDFEWVVRMAEANVPRIYWPLELANTMLKDQPALAFVRGAVARVEEVVSRGVGFSLFGELGCGKTTLAIYFLKAALRAGFSGYFALMESFLNAIKASFDERTLRDRVEAMGAVQVLVLDDLGREHRTLSGFVPARLDELIRWRDSMGLTTIFTTNRSGEEVKEIYGGNIISLLQRTNRPLTVQRRNLRAELNEWRDA